MGTGSSEAQWQARKPLAGDSYMLRQSVRGVRRPTIPATVLAAESAFFQDEADSECQYEDPRSLHPRLNSIWDAFVRSSVRPVRGSKQATYML